ncbi:hypothetical protein P8452_20507 [Trifolium repens]|nr:hypothetical protein P8452_20507 [Trifolium repens]
MAKQPPPEPAAPMKPPHHTIRSKLPKPSPYHKSSKTERIRSNEHHYKTTIAPPKPMVTTTTPKHNHIHQSTTDP